MTQVVPVSGLIVLLLLAGCHRQAPSPASTELGPAVAPQVTQEQLERETAAFCNLALPNNRVTVLAQEAPVSESNERTIRGLTFPDGAHRRGSAPTAILGTTETAFGLKMKFQLNTRTAPMSGAACSRLELDVDVNMPYHTVFVAREFKPGTCAFEKIRIHEYRHVEVNNAALHEAASTLQTEMRTFFGNRIFYGDSTALRGQLNAALEDHWIPRLQELKNLVLSNHESIDTEEEYESNQTDCDGDIPRTIEADPKLREMFIKRPQATF